MKSDLNRDPISQAETSVIASVMQSLRRVTTFAELIRLSGAALIVFALSLFLLQGVDATNDLHRYHLLLLQTSLLGAAGFAVGVWLKEPRGARVFFSLGLISIPANLAVLGAMMYSIMPATHLSERYPHYASWQASSLSEIVLATVTGLIVIVPMSLFAFSVLARRSRTWLTCGYLFASSLLLLPVRGSVSVTILSVMVVFLMVLLINSRKTERMTTLTLEEKFSRVLLFLPPLLMLARSAVLYSSVFHFTLVLVIAAYMLLRQWSGSHSGVSFWTNLLHVLTALVATWVSILSGGLVADYIILPGASLVFLLILGALLLDLSRVVANGTIRWLMHFGWAGLCVLMLFVNYLSWNGTVSFVHWLLVCALMSTSGFIFRSKLIAYLGALGIAGGMLGHGHQVLGGLLHSNWMTVATIGAVAIICASLIERHGVAIKLKAQNLARRCRAQSRDTSTQLQMDGAASESTCDPQNDLAA